MTSGGRKRGWRGTRSVHSPADAPRAKTPHGHQAGLRRERPGGKPIVPSAVALAGMPDHVQTTCWGPRREGPQGGKDGGTFGNPGVRKKGRGTAKRKRRGY